MLADLSVENQLEILANDKFEVIFHLASHVGQESSFADPYKDLSSNTLPTIELLKWAPRFQTKHLIFASSVNVYGNPAIMPITETTPISLPSPYAIGKFASEQLCNLFESANFGCTTLRLFNVYGPGQDMLNLSQGIASIYMAYAIRNKPILVKGSLERFRDLVFVDDVAEAFIKCAETRAYGKTYNVCSGKKTYVKDLIRCIVESLDKDPETYPITAGKNTKNDQFGFVGDNSKLINETGWQPKVSLEEGLRLMAADFIKRYQVSPDSKFFEVTVD